MDKTRSDLFGICSWELLHACNYRCPYCPFIPFWRDAPEATSRKHLGSTLQDWLDFWRRIHDRHGAFRIEISGGEPFEYPDFHALVSELCRRHEVHILTNLSWKVETALERFDKDKVSFLAIFHPHTAELGEFLTKAGRLQKRGFTIHTLAIAYPPMLGRLRELRAAFKDKGIVFVIAPFNGEYQGRSYPGQYTAEEKELIWPAAGKERPLWEFSLESRSPRGAECASGMRYFRAYPDGSIYRCLRHRDISGSQPLGVMQDPNFRMLDRPLPCPSEYCHCPLEYGNLAFSRPIVEQP